MAFLLRYLFDVDAGGASRKSTASSIINSFRPAGTSFSNFFRNGKRHHCARDVWTLVYARRSSLSDLFFMDSVIFELLS